MARNIEIKARVSDLGKLEARVREIADRGPFELRQDDTFFATHSGRLKLRAFEEGNGELIFYRREDAAGPRLSEYSVVPTSRPRELRLLLEQALGITGRVRKRRRVYLAGNTRVHLDQVEGLGCFLELEVVLSDSQSIAEGEAVARGLMSRLGVTEASLIDGAYIDLLRKSEAPSPQPNG